MKQLGYLTKFLVLNARHHGIPQKAPAVHWRDS
ncbi:MAG: hypothetical protein ACKPKO_14850 [Candidatus Fonsibacter sp.]